MTKIHAKKKNITTTKYRSYLSEKNKSWYDKYIEKEANQPQSELSNKSFEIVKNNDINSTDTEEEYKSDTESNYESPKKYDYIPSKEYDSPQNYDYDPWDDLDKQYCALHIDDMNYYQPVNVNKNEEEDIYDDDEEEVGMNYLIKPSRQWSYR